MTAIGTRRPREGRCDRCEKPLTDLVWETWESIAPWGAPLPPVTDWREQDGTDTHCAGDPFCDAPEIDWCARALAAEADLADAEARGRQHGLFEAWCELYPRTGGMGHALPGAHDTDFASARDLIAGLAAEATDGR